MQELDVNDDLEKNSGGLVWITGYSGAGKTTVAQEVYEGLRKLSVPAVLLDGDDIRSILGERFGHDLEDRRQLASVYGRLCKKLADSGITVIIATIAMFEAVRKENRVSNSRYLEVYLDVPLEIRVERDPKGLYKAAAARGASDRENTPGLEVPESPDLIIRNYDEISPASAAAQIVSSYKSLLEGSDLVEEYGGDAADVVTNPETGRSQYWDSYYKKRSAPIAPSSFALFCSENYLTDHCHILEFGCGNGRDAFYFSKNHRVTAIDESGVVVDANRARAVQEGMMSIDFIHGQYGTPLSGMPAEVDAIYSRFVIHAMPEDAETSSLEESWRLLKANGRLFLEFRTTLDPLMKKGERISETERKTDHYRRFVDFSTVCNKLTNIGFSLVYKIEKRGLARFGNDDPVVGRLVAVKKG
jgi:adenylylsulfate kinase-like enzyme/protein-L-isoaspartate O-methyltransferase